MKTKKEFRDKKKKGNNGGEGRDAFSGGVCLEGTLQLYIFSKF